MENLGFKPSEVTKLVFTDAISPEQRGSTISVKDFFGGRVLKPYVNDSKVHDANFAFLSNALAKLNPELYQPLSHTTYLDDLKDCIDYGGGFVDFVTYHTVNYAGMMNEYRNLFGNNANYIPRVNAAMTQEKVNVYTFQVAYDLRFIELEKMSKLQLSKNIQEIYGDIITIGWDLFSQTLVYTGAPGRTGLFNSDDKVMTITIDNNDATEANSGFAGMTDDAVCSWLNGVFETYMVNSNDNYTIFPDTILVPTFVGKDLSGRGSALYTNTLRKFLEEFNLGKDESEEDLKIRIRSRRALNTLGTGGHGRIVAYRRDKRFVRVDVPYPIKHYITLPNIEKMSYTTSFAGQISEIQMPYNTSDTELGIITYWDFAK